ncbi:MAG: hypothetical protein R3F61_28470 [Myxococcota bacterium]
MSALVLVLLSSASASELHSCSATLSSSTGSSTTVSGFGLTEDDARRAARQSARLLADQRLVIEAGLAWTTEDATYTDRLASWVATEGTRRFAAPGWTFTIGECSAKAFEPADAWSARWASGSELVTRTNPADALEAARRRACFTVYQVSFMQTLKKLDDPSVDPLGTLTAWEGAWTQLSQCFAQAAPPAAPTAPLGPDSAGPARCAAIGADGTSVAMGFGTTAERAAEDALRQSVIARSRSIVGQMGRARVVDAPTERSANLRALLGQMATFTGASDVVDRARLACSEVTPDKVVWRPEGRREQDCNLASWTERPTDPVEPANVGAFLDQTCTLQVDPTMQIVRFSLRGAEGEKRDTLVGSAYRVGADCEAACYADAKWGTAPKPFTLAGVADRTDKRKVVASLEEAATSGGPLKGLELLPTQQDPAALGALFSGQTWEKLKAEFKTLPNAADRWKQLEGHWILLP